MRAMPAVALLLAAALAGAGGSALAQSALAQSTHGQSIQHAPQSQNSQDQLFAQLAKAQDREEAAPIEDKLEALFRASGSPSVDLLMNRTDVAVAHGDMGMARKLVDAVTHIAPDYAEGWHVRAMLESHVGEDAAAMASLQRTIALNPRQFNAMRSLAGMLDDYGDKAGALKLYRQAHALDPQLEGVDRRLRALMREIEGQDI